MNIQCPPMGRKTSKIAIVGEAPGEYEALSHEPFKGKSGIILMNMLRAHGSTREEVYLTNVIKERPINNSISELIHLDSKVVGMSSEYKMWEESLYAELNECKANVIVAVGSTALWALTRERGIMNLRGSILEAVPELGGRKVIPIINPRYNVRRDNPDGFLANYWLSRDMSVICENSLFPEIKLLKRYYHIRPTRIEIFDYLRNIRDNIFSIACDIEVKFENISCISFGISPTDVMTVPLIYENGEYFTLEDEIGFWSLVTTILEDPDIEIIFQNGCFDAMFFMRHLGIRTNNMQDTMVAQGLLFPDMPKSLGYQTSMYTDIVYYKDEGREALRGLYPDAAHWDRYWTYCAKDSAATFSSYIWLTKELIRRRQTTAYNRRVEIIPTLLYCQEQGLPIDIPSLRAHSKVVEKELQILYRKMEETLIVKPDNIVTFCNSPKQLSNYFYKTLGHKPIRNKKKRITTDKLALVQLARHSVREAEILLDIRRRTKLRNTYLEMKFDGDSRMRSQFNPAGTKTGRLSSSGTIFGTGANHQNLDKVIKRYIHSDDGKMFVEIDLQRAENTIVAHIVPVPSLLDAMRKGIDTHKLTYSRMFGIPIDEVSTEPGSCELGVGTKSMRFWGKQCNHALNYNLGPIMFAKSRSIPFGDGKRFHDKFHRAYPEIKQVWHTRIKAQLYDTRVITNCYGTERLFQNRLQDAHTLMAAYAQCPQSTVADKISQDGFIYMQDNQDIFSPLEMFTQVHDSLVFQIPTDIGWDQVSFILTKLCESLQKPIPFKNPFSLGTDVCIGKVWSKLMEVESLEPNALEGVYQKIIWEYEHNKEGIRT